MSDLTAARRHRRGGARPRALAPAPEGASARGRAIESRWAPGFRIPRRTDRSTSAKRLSMRRGGLPMESRTAGLAPLEPFMSSSDYYAVLEVEPTATDEDIRRAYRRLVRVHHPDLNPEDPNAADRTRAINEAYTVLGDPSARAAYDSRLSPRRTAGAASPDPDGPTPNRHSRDGHRTRARQDAPAGDIGWGWRVWVDGARVGEERTEAGALMLLGLARKKGILAAILATSDHPNLVPGRWIVFSGRLESRWVGSASSQAHRPED